MRKGGKQKATADVVLNMLKVADGLSSAAPYLPLVIKALIQVVETYKKYGSNHESLTSLGVYVDSMNTMIKTTLQQHGGKDCPGALGKHLEVLQKNVQLVVDEVKKVESKALPLRFLNSASIGEELDECLHRLAWYLHNFSASVMMSIYIAVDDITDVVRHEIQQQGDRIVEELSKNMTFSLFNLRHAPQARFDANSGRSECIQATCTEILTSIYHWISLGTSWPLSNFTVDPAYQVRTDAFVLWINGLAGSGKTTLAQTIARQCDDVKCLGASFFCARFGDRSNIQLIFPTIALHLAQQNEAFLAALKVSAAENPDIYQALPSRQLEKLIVQPLRVMSGSLARHVIIIDALDECRDTDPVSAILVALSAHISSLGPLKFIITSRPDDNIMRGFDQQTLRRCTHDYPLHRIPQEVVRRDISIYIQSHISTLQHTHKLGKTWPGEARQEALKELMGDLFIVVSTIFKYIDDPVENNPERQLEALIHREDSATFADSTSLAPINTIYTEVLKKAFPKEPTPSTMAELKIVLGSVVLLRDQLSSSSLEYLLHLGEGTVQRTLRRLHSVLVVPTDGRDPIRIIHPSFPDFLMDTTRCPDQRFAVQRELQHNVLAKHCLRTLNDSLKWNLCGLDYNTHLNNEITDLHSIISSHIPLHLRYACRYWSEHMCAAIVDEELLQLLHTFSETHLLHWLEVLSLIGYMDVVVETLPKTMDILSDLPRPPTHIVELLYDCTRMVNTGYPAISASAGHVYISALPSCPSTSALCAVYSSYLPRSPAVHIGLQSHWSSNTMTMEGHTEGITSVSYSPYGEQIMSTSGDNTIRLWSSLTGAQLHVLQEKSQVCYAAFSPDGKEIISGTAEGVVSLWDARTGARIASQEAHSAYVRAVAYSQAVQSHYAASGSHDKEIYLWNTSSGKLEMVDVLKGHSDWILSLSFSHDGSFLVSGGGDHDKTCKIWTISDPTQVRTLKHNSAVLRVAISPDDKIIACGCENEVLLWPLSGASSSEVYLKRLIVEGSVWGLDFSPDGGFLAVGCSLGEGSWIRLWDSDTGEWRGRQEDVRGERISGLRFSPDGSQMVSAHGGGTVHSWDVRLMMRKGGPSSPNRSGSVQHFPSHTILAVAFSPCDSNILAAVVEDGAVALWDVFLGVQMRKMAHPQPGTLDPSYVALTWSPGGLHLALSGHTDHSIVLYDTVRGVSTCVVRHHTSDVLPVVFTSDSLVVVSGSEDGYISTWDTVAGFEMISFSVTGTKALYAIAVSPCKDYIVVASMDPDCFLPTSRTRVRRVSSSHPLIPYTVKGYPTIRLYNLTSSAMIWKVTHHHAITALSFSSDGSRLVGSSEHGQISLWDFSPFLQPQGHSAAPEAPVFRAIPSSHTLHLLAELISEASSPVERIRFSADQRGLITNTSYTEITYPSHWPLLLNSVPPTAQGYYLSNGWIWCVHRDVGPHRVCWLPPMYRYTSSAVSYARVLGGWDFGEERIAFATNGGRLVVVDVSDCQLH